MGWITIFPDMIGVIKIRHHFPKLPSYPNQRFTSMSYAASLTRRQSFPFSPLTWHKMFRSVINFHLETKELTYNYLGQEAPPKLVTHHLCSPSITNNPSPPIFFNSTACIHQPPESPSSSVLLLSLDPQIAAPPGTNLLFHSPIHL